jgi:hypothetical protein
MASAAAKSSEQLPNASMQASTLPFGVNNAPQDQYSAIDTVDKFFAEHDSSTTDELHTTSPMPPSAINDPKVQQAYASAEIAWYRYLKDGYRFRTKAFERQLTLSLWIFIVVVILVLSGVVFAGFQLFAGLFPKRPKIPVKSVASRTIGNTVTSGTPLTAPLVVSTSGVASGSSVTNIPLEPANTPDIQMSNASQTMATTSSSEQIELEMSLTSFVVRTSVVGVVVLAISCAFFFLYLKIVYPIETTSW